jgi:hypothetical protein
MSLIDLSHITKPKAAPPARKAWPEGGKIVAPNKELLTKIFLLKKQSKGIALNAVELSLLEAYKHIDVEVPAVSPVAAGSETEKTAKKSPAVGDKRKREESPGPAVAPLKDRLSMSLDDILKSKSGAKSGSGSSDAPAANGSNKKQKTSDGSAKKAVASGKDQAKPKAAAPDVPPIKDRLSMSLDDLVAKKGGKR